MKQAFLQLHLAVLLASCSGIFGNLISLDPVLITGYRMLLASVMLLLLLFIKYGRIIVGRKDSHILWLGVLLAFHWIFFYGSIKYANVSVGVVCFCLSGFFTALISPWINRKRISWVELLLSSLTLAGISLILHFDASVGTGRKDNGFADGRWNFCHRITTPFLSCKQIFVILASLLGRSRVFDPVSLGLYGLYVYVIKPGAEDNQCFYRESEF